MNALEDAKKYIGQTRLWSMKAVHPTDLEVTCVRITAHISFDGDSSVFTQLSVWCKYNDRGRDGSVWFIPDRFESLDLVENEPEVQDAPEDQDEPDHCAVCAGTGEGMFDGTNCNSCGGKGFAK